MLETGAAAGALLWVAALGLAVAACGGTNNSQSTPSAGERPAAQATDGAAAGGVAAAVPPELAPGERLFDASCARCHGPRATGTAVGPALVHTVYEPNHHGDAAFQLAVAQGSRAHHWSFGDMPPVPGVTPEQVAEITAYVRWLQRQAGIGG